MRMGPVALGRQLLAFLPVAFAFAGGAGAGAGLVALTYDGLGRTQARSNATINPTTRNTEAL